eukprot:2392476-Amphidinium_carterae.1
MVWELTGHIAHLSILYARIKDFLREAHAETYGRASFENCGLRVGGNAFKLPHHCCSSMTQFRIRSATPS